MRQGLLLCLMAWLAGAATLERVAGGGSGSAGAPAKEIRFIEPFGVAFDTAGNWYVCEFQGHRVIRIDRQGRTSLFAGTGTKGYSGDGGPAAEGMLNEPHGIVISPDQQMYIADTHNNRVRKVDLKSGVMTTVAGNGEKGYSGDGGPAVQASFNGVFAIDLSPDGRRLWVADLSNRRVRKVDLKNGMVTTVAGNGQNGVPPDGAKAAESPLVDPRAVTEDRNSNVYILERRGNALRVVDREGAIRTVIAGGSIQPDLNGPKHLCMDRNGEDVIIADAENHLIRLYSPKTGKTTTIAGTGERGDRLVSGNPLESLLSRPHGVTVHPSGDLYISDSYNHRILRMRR